MGHEMEDAELVRGCLAGEAPCQERLVQDHLRMVLSIASSFTRDIGQAEDLCQEIFERVFTKLAGFQARSRLRTWIYAVAVSHCINAVRKVTPVLGELSDRCTVASTTSSPENAVLLRETVEAVHRAVNSLPEEYRAVVMLSAFDNRTAHEIAAILGIPEGTVFSRLNKGRDLLRRKLSRLMNRTAR